MAVAVYISTVIFPEYDSLNILLVCSTPLHSVAYNCIICMFCCTKDLAL